MAHIMTDADKESIRQHFADTRTIDIAHHIGCCYSSVTYYSHNFGLCKSQAFRSAQTAKARMAGGTERNRRISAKQRENIRRDKRRLMLGLEPIYARNYGEDSHGRKEWQARYRLANRNGYICERTSKVFYYNSVTRRSARLERRYEKYGFVFEELQEEKAV